jgi:DNA-binding IclR family transcriptional regulator
VARDVTDKPTRLQKYAAPALEKGLDILELLALQAQTPLSHADIAKGLGRSKNEIFRMMVVLEERGYIERGAEDLFCLTPKIANLTAPRSEARLREVAQPFLSRLSEETGHSNHMWVIADGKMRVALSTGSAAPYSLSLKEGEEGALFQSSAGACFLSGQPDPAQRLQMLHDLGEFVDADTYGAFDPEVETCAKQQISVQPSLQARGVMEVSAPVRIDTGAPDGANSSGSVLAAVTVPMLGVSAQDNDVARVCDALRHAVQSLGLRLSLLTPVTGPTF